MDLLTLIIGAVGLVLLLVAFIFNVRKKTRSNVILYNLMQLIGAGLLCAYAYITDSQIFFVLEGVWVFVALYFLYENVLILKNKTKLKKKK